MVSRHQNVGRCIYCDSVAEPLSREHVLPRGLGGNRSPQNLSEAMVLLRASCEECRRITQTIEDHCLNHQFGPVRARLRLNRKDRAKKDWPATVALQDGRIERRSIPIDQIPASMIIPSLPLAAILGGAACHPPDILLHQVVIEEDKRERNPQFRSVSIDLKYDCMLFTRMLSKIALGLAHYTFGEDIFEPIVRDFIRLGSEHPNQYVGGYCGRSNSPSMFDSGHHSRLWQHSGYLIATIQLFAVPGSPVNYVVVGRLRSFPDDLPTLSLGNPIEIVAPSSEAVTSNGQTKISWRRVAP